MKRSALHFETVPRYTLCGQRSRRWQSLLAFLLLALSLTYTGWLVLQFSQAAEATKALQEQGQALKAALAATAPSKRKASLLPAENATGLGAGLVGNLTAEKRRMLNAVIQQLNIPWHDVFEQLEGSTPQDVALLSIEPDGQRGAIKLQAEAKSLDTLLLYAASLQQQGVFGRLSYRKHETNEQDSNKPDRLSFELELRTPARLKPTAEVVSDASTQTTASKTPKVQP